MLTVTPFIRSTDAIQKDGKTAVYIRLIYMRKQKCVSTRIKIDPRNWDPLKKQIKKSETHAVQLNLLLQQICTETQQSYYEQRIKNMPFSFEKAILIVKGGVITSFKAFATSEIENRPVGASTKKVLTNCVNNVQAYRKNCSLNDIDGRFIAGYKKYLIETLHHGYNTVIGDLSRLKSILAAAKRDGLIKENPFTHFRVGGYKPKQDFISETELLYIVSRIPQMDPADKKACTHFCFMCCTGLRYSDLKQLNYAMLQRSPQGYYFKLKQVKTNDPVLVPLSDLALSFIDTSLTSGRVFRVTSNQAFNRQLLTAMSRIKINKRVTTHMGRHSFITISLQKGMSKTTTGKIAGHQRSATTDGYTHLQIDDLFKDLQKWNVSPAGGGLEA